MTSTHDEFFWAYALADAALLAAIGLAFRPGISRAAEDRRRRAAGGGGWPGCSPLRCRSARSWPTCFPWQTSGHPAAWLYVTSVAVAAFVAGVALAGPWRRHWLGPFGAVCLFTLVVLGIDMMTGSRLQLETPFGLSVLKARPVLRHRQRGAGHRRLRARGRRLAGPGGTAPVLLPAAAVLAVAVVAAFAVFASGWPGFGGKVGGPIAMVPCFALLAMAVGGIRLNWRGCCCIILASGLALFAVFALVNYFVPITGKSDIGSFAGSSLHGHSSGLLLRKINSNIGSLFGQRVQPADPIVVVWTGLMLWRPSSFGLKTEPRAYAAEPLTRALMGVIWLLPVLGWFADDSGVIVPAAALPFALPLGIGILAAAAYPDRRRLWLETTVPIAGSSR